MNIKEIAKGIIPPFLLNLYYYSLSLAGAVAFGFPGKSKKIKIIGVTGTSGKSTVVDLCSRIFEEAGIKVAALSSIKFKIGEKEWENKLKMTMPGRFAVQRFIHQAIKNECRYVFLEVTSEGIRQFRHKFIDFEVAVFNNLSPEHIESHKGFENYRKEKLKLFKSSDSIHIINVDDENAKYFIDMPAKRIIGFGMNVKNQNMAKFSDIVYANDILFSLSGSDFFIKDTKFHLNLFGEFNVYNSLAASCVALSQGLSLDDCKKGLASATGIPGRMEIISKSPFYVIVDYAHTPKQLEAVYQTIKKMMNGSGNLICVLGSCGGGRDKWKRPVLGQIAKKYCSDIFVTNEDPYDEDPTEIINSVASGVGENVNRILDRAEAIGLAIAKAKPSDAVIITGKGSEPWMAVSGGKKIPWDDRAIARESLILKFK